MKTKDNTEMQAGGEKISGNPETVWIKVHPSDDREIYGTNFKRDAYTTGTALAQFCGKGDEALHEAVLAEIMFDTRTRSEFFAWDDCSGAWRHVSLTERSLNVPESCR